MNKALRDEYLAAMNLETWVVRANPARVTPPASKPSAGKVPTAAASTGIVPSMTVPGVIASAATASAAAVSTAPAAAPTVITASGIAMPSGSVHAAAPREADCDWEQLRARVAACTRCALSATRTQTVFGVGSPTAEWLIVGEAPGAEEDRQGEPFVGRAGQLLNSMLRAIGLAREQVYIANVLKCRPPGNRDPAANEAAECLPYLERQIALIKPKIMLAVGRIASQHLLRTDVPLGRLRQQVHAFGVSQVPLVVTYHPAYLLRTPTDKRKAWEDLKFAREVRARV